MSDAARMKFEISPLTQTRPRCRSISTAADETSSDTGRRPGIRVNGQWTWTNVAGVFNTLDRVDNGAATWGLSRTSISAWSVTAPPSSRQQGLKFRFWRLRANGQGHEIVKERRRMVGHRNLFRAGALLSVQIYKIYTLYPHVCGNVRADDRETAREALPDVAVRGWSPLGALAGRR